MFSKYLVTASSLFVALTSAASTVDLDALLLLPGVESHDGVDTVFSTKDFYQVSFVKSIAPAIVNSSVIFHDVSRGVAMGNVKSRASIFNPRGNVLRLGTVPSSK
ncbi:YCL049C-like protein [Saccharomyces cerevisiae Vin13]|nr:YCL049C-like protein [Saccharomyces cerevisiae Vin13]